MSRWLITEVQIDIHAIDHDGNAAIHFATQHGFQAMLEELIHYGVNVNIQNGSGCTPLHIACQFGDLAMVEALVNKFSANVNVTDCKGRTPLHYACETPGVGIKIARVLLDCGRSNREAKDEVSSNSLSDCSNFNFLTEFLWLNRWGLLLCKLLLKPETRNWQIF